MSAAGAIQDLIAHAIAIVRANDPGRPALIGVGGAQGSGKSFQCRAFAAAHADVAHFSLDDVYLTHSEREELARDIHPLCATRGPPGTHDLDLADRTLAALDNAAAHSKTPLPRFDKATDDRAPESAWPVFAGRPSAVLLEGWCVGARGLEAAPPVNDLEQEDRDGVWRAFTLEALNHDYVPFFAALDATIYLQAPSWDIVRRWRGEQEQELRGRPLTPAEDLALDRFVMHYERITRAMLDGQHQARWIVRLDEARNVIGIDEQS